MTFLSWLRRKRAGFASRPGLPFDGGLEAAWLTDDLLIAAAPRGSQWSRLFNAGVSAVLEVRDEDIDDQIMMKANRVAYRRFPVPDRGAPSQIELRTMVEWVTARLQERHKVMIHCGLGLGRSAMVGCATLVVLGFPLDVAYQLLRRAQPGVALSTRQVRVLEVFATTVEHERRGTA